MPHSTQPQNPIIHQFGDRHVPITSELLGLIITDIIGRVLKHNKEAIQEPLDQIILNKYTYLKLKKEAKKDPLLNQSNLNNSPF